VSDLASLDRISSHDSYGDQLLKPAEVAAILRVTPRTVARYAEDGRLDRVMLSSRLSRYTRESVEALIGGEAS
jgi:predicted site-specific integrase-resolvase